MISDDIVQVFHDHPESNVALPSRQRILQSIPVADRLVHLLHSPESYSFICCVRPAMERGRHEKGGVEAHSSMLSGGHSPVLPAEHEFGTGEGYHDLLRKLRP